MTPQLHALHMHSLLPLQNTVSGFVHEVFCMHATCSILLLFVKWTKIVVVNLTSDLIIVKPMRQPIPP